MKYENIKEAVFIKRTNRFIAACIIDGIEEKVYVPNTGRCKELFITGSKVYVSKSNNPKRVTKYTLTSVYKDKRLINIDSQAPNSIVEEALKAGTIFKEYNFSKIVREKTFNNSRFDIYYEAIKDDKEIKGFIEVKGVTLEEDNIAYFPDAPTLRGLKHIQELVIAKEKGYSSHIVFLVQMENIKSFLPNVKMQPEFGSELNKAQHQGVEIKSFECRVKADEILLSKEVPVGDLSSF
ncbi:DNA/RNA nuclease SfsA [Anaerosphaera multitolerans]|uniref:Sugar fermentation stimulation protein homolog n=1 Tax=Anaerosphaera multitolerans TaxID=2487351 RepID=A0A437S970_9FIRM|nr:DNA/RNA nuclease SfsA [Anaerosphaera multitolerans]RVU55378.1 DNA/RNA nuclease SfsA [Anaerosphaera multitolerans]